MESTTGKSINYTQNFMQLGAQQGWQCPVCKRVLGPWIPECPCQGRGKETYTTTMSDTTSLEDFSKLQEEAFIKYNIANKED